MPLTNLDKAKIRLYLGFSTEGRQWNPRLESRMDQLNEESRSAELILVRQILPEIEKFKEQTRSGGAAFKSAGIKKVDEVEFFGEGEGGGRLEAVRQSGRSLCSELSIMMGVPLVGDYFGDQGYQGDQAWAGAGFQMGRGGVIPLG